MPPLKWFPPEGAPRVFSLHKPVSTVGRALGNDVAVPTAGLSETHVQILFDGRDFNLEEVDKNAEILINGKKKRRARLVHGDRLTLGDAELQFSMFDEPHRREREAQRSGTEDGGSRGATAVTTVAGLRKLYEFSEKLMTMTKINELLEAMLDAVIEVTGAEKGLILLLDDVTAGPRAALEGEGEGNA